MNRFIYLALIFFVAFVLCFILAAKGFSGTRNSVQLPVLPWSPVVLIRNGTSACSGSVVEVGLILTAGHCTDRLNQSVVVSYMDGSSVAGTVVARHYEQCGIDWSLIKANTEGRHPLTLAPLTAEIGETYYRIGHPHGDVTETYEAVRPTLVGQRTLSTATYLIGGESGSPLVDAKERIVGVAICTTRYYGIYFNPQFIASTIAYFARKAR